MKLFALLSFLPAAAALGYCNDKDVSCAGWGKRGECTGANSEVVKAKCPHTCGVCTIFCEDTQKECDGWRRDGECKNSPDFMSPKCPTSCGLCSPLCAGETTDSDADYNSRLAGRRKTPAWARFFAALRSRSHSAV